MATTWWTLSVITKSDIFGKVHSVGCQQLNQDSSNDLEYVQSVLCKVRKITITIVTPVFFNVATGRSPKQKLYLVTDAVTMNRVPVCEPLRRLNNQERCYSTEPQTGTTIKKTPEQQICWCGDLRLMWND